MDSKARQSKLKNKYFFHCNCSICKNDIYDVSEEEQMAKSQEMFHTISISKNWNVLVNYLHHSVQQLRNKPVSMSKRLIRRYAEIYDHLARLEYSQQDIEKSIDYCNKAIELLILVYGAQAPEIGHELLKLASLYEIAGDYSRKDELYKKAEHILELHFGKEGSDLLLAKDL